jgi:hypothetical protein
MADTVHAMLQRMLRLVDTLYPLGPVYTETEHDSFANWYTEIISKESFTKFELVDEINVKELKGAKGWKVDAVAKEESKKFDTAGGKVWFFNTKIAKENSDVKNICGTENIEHRRIPNGINVFKAYNDPEMGQAQAQLVKIFDDQKDHQDETILRHAPSIHSKTKMLFYTPERDSEAFYQINEYDENPVYEKIKKDIVQPNFKDAIKSLYMADYRILAGFLVRYAVSIADLLECEFEYVEKCGLMCLKYEPGSGIKRHIDGVAYFDNVFGPIVTLAMGADGGKVFDMYPTLLDESDAVPVRISTKPYETMIMQGQARAEWSHSVPTGNANTQYTIAFKFGNVASDASVIAEKTVYMDSSYPFVNFQR